LEFIERPSYSEAVNQFGFGSAIAPSHETPLCSTVAQLHMQAPATETSHLRVTVDNPHSETLNGQGGNTLPDTITLTNWYDRCTDACSLRSQSPTLNPTYCDCVWNEWLWDAAGWFDKFDSCSRSGFSHKSTP